MVICDFNCFECKFTDCILDFDSGLFLDCELETSQYIDDILFNTYSHSHSIEVPDYRLYPFIPSDEIPYNPNWKSQSRWREYYRSRARGNRKEKIKAYSLEYRKKHHDEILLRGREYYKSHREERKSYSRKYLEEHREKNKLSCRKNYIKNREKRLAYQREYYLRKKSEKS